MNKSDTSFQKKKQFGVSRRKKTIHRWSLW